MIDSIVTSIFDEVKRVNNIHDVSEIRYSLVNDNAVPPTLSSEHKGFYIFRQMSRDDKIDTGVRMTIPRKHELHVTGANKNIIVFTEGTDVPIVLDAPSSPTNHFDIVGLGRVMQQVSANLVPK